MVAGNDRRSREGFVHPYVVDAGVDRTSVKLLIRDFNDGASSPRRRHSLRALAARRRARGAAARRRRPRSKSRIATCERCSTSIRWSSSTRGRRCARAGLTVRERPIRGGTDGSRLSFMGLPTPNIFAGEQNFHSRLEWVSVQDMEKAVEVIVELAKVWEERTP